ncbi:SLIT and NTRK-like protein 6 isoform X2 [Parambassis ranga]|uniref:SLIT and NTRK-like protein 6 isoform X2 n=1 Tax=Parambassis ranga TaxID=210632 RepID=A0A6P7KFU2_9TELE|nr:SLIT and NTRK-like protein 6 isoform X2 [Parambassis ranga]
MERHRLPLLLLSTVICAVSAMENAAEPPIIEPLIRNFTNKNLQVIPGHDGNVTVTTLVMEGNLITLSEEDRQALATYPALQELHLEGNMITGVPAKYFSVLPRLRVLSLSRNNLSSLDPEAFAGLDFLTELDLSQNLLMSLPAQLRGLKDLQMLILKDNPWNCSCPLLSTIKDMNAANVSIGGPQVICASPAEQAGKSLLGATALCFPSPTPTVNIDPETPTAPAQTQQSQSSTAMLMTTLSTSQNRSSEGACARQHMEVHSVCCRLGANHLYTHRVRHQGAVLVQALPQLQTSATAGG